MRTIAALLLSMLCHQAFALDVAKSEVIDLTHDFSESTLYWPTSNPFDLDSTFHGMTDKGFFYSANEYAASEHGGTHVDAPIHFAKEGQTLDQIPLSQLMGPAVIIDVQTQTKDNRDYLVQVSDLEQWEKDNHPMPDGAIVLLNTGFAQYWPDAKQYLGTTKKGPEGVRELSFPGLSAQAATWLVEQRNIHAVGIDTASIDYGKSTDFQAHRILAKQNIPILENVANINAIGKQAYIMALPMKIQGGSGGPVRIVALKD